MRMCLRWAAGLLLIQLVFSTVSAVEKLDIKTDQDTAYLPYRIKFLDVQKHSDATVRIDRASQVFRAAVGESEKALYVRPTPPLKGTDFPFTMDLRSSHPSELVRQRAIQKHLLRWQVYDEVSTGRRLVIGTARWNDSAWVFRLDPESMEYEQLFLMTGEDGTGDGKWKPNIPIVLIEDYDYDGVTEAFVHVNRIREKGFRTLFCVEMETMKVEWSLRVACDPSAASGFFSLRDSLNPGVIFYLHGPQQGAEDENFSDRFGYVTAVNNRGEITLNRVIKIRPDGGYLNRAETDGLYYLFHEIEPTSPDSVLKLVEQGLEGSLQTGEFRISKIDRTGIIHNSVTIPAVPSWSWYHRYGPDDQVCLYLRLRSKNVRVYDGFLNLLAESEPVGVTPYIGDISIEGYDDAILCEGGIYSSDWELLAKFPPGLSAEPIMYGDDGTVKRLLLWSNTQTIVGEIERRALIDMLVVFYVNNRIYVLMAFASLLAGLLVMNFYRGRARRNMLLIGEQKKELEETHRALKEAQARIVAQERYEQARDIAGGFAHEIRNALSPARNALARLVPSSGESSLDSKSQKLTRLVDRAVVRAVDLTQLISNYTKLEEHVDPEEVDTSQIVRDVLSDYQVLLEDKGIEVSVPETRTPMVTGNREQLTIVISNLIRNSIDALSGVENPRIDISWKVEGETLVMSVSDNGCGIGPDDRARVFDFFYSTKPDTGTGVGLAMSKKIVEMYDGEIEVESEPGDGTAFRVSMNVVRTFLAFLIVSLLSIGGAGAVEKLEINSDQNESYLPLKFVHQDSIALGSHSAYVSYMSSMLSPTVVGDTGKAHYLSINPASVLNDGAMTFDYTSFPPRQLVHQRAVQIRRFHWETYQDPGMDRPGVFGAGRWMDTAWAIYFDPFTREIEKKFLMTGEDGTGDGKWMPEFSIPLVEDYDYDGRAEAFVWVNRVREKGVRTLFCIEAQTLDIEWSIPVASGIGPHNGFFSLRDSTNPGIIFACNGSQQGASDSNFSDMYGYLTVINSRGEITFSCVSRVGTDGHVLSRSHADGLYYLTHDMDFISHDSMMALEAINGVAALRDGKHRISLIDRNGNTYRSCDLEQPGWDCWTMPYGSEHETAVYMRSLDKRVRVFDTSLTLLAVSEPTDIGTFVDRISVSGYGDVLQFGNGLYSLDLTQLARQEGILDMQPMVTDSAGALVRVLIPNSRWMTISDIEMRSTWELLGIFYVNNKNYFLAAISSLLVGLLVMNAYRGRAKRNLVLISEQKRELEDTHRALKEAQARIVAQERYEQARDIAGGFAHEIRNALSPARNALTRLVGPERKSLSDDKAEKLSRLVDRAVVRAVDLTQLISSYTRLEAARNPEDVDIRNVIDDVLRSNALVFEDRGIDVTVSSEDVPSVTCNLDQSVVVVDNLVKNAVDALVGVEEPRIEISLLYKGETVELLFTDNGCGIREECRGRVFDFFYSTKPDTGTGVGLAMVKKIVEMYGGGIEVESEPHSGTTFRLQLRTI